MKPKFRWKDAPHPSLDAQTVGEELERIRLKNNGRLTSKDVLEAARPPKALLHKAFIWENAKAADAFRLEQAGELIRSIEVVVEIKKGSPRNLRAFVSVRRNDDRSYTSLAHAMSDKQLRQQVLDRAWDELQSWRHRHDDLRELAEVHAAIDKLEPPKAA